MPGASAATAEPEAAEQRTEADTDEHDAVAAETPQASAEAEPEAPAPAEADARQRRPRSRAASSGPLKASPIARKIADENGLDLRTLAGRGCGPDGRIVRADVEKLIERQGRREELPPSPSQAARAGARGGGRPQEDDEVVELSKMQRIIARRMAESKSTVPHFYLTAEVDMDEGARRCARSFNAALEPEGIKVSASTT